MPATKSFTNAEIAEMLREIAVAYDALGENRFKIIAYNRAAETIAHHPQPVRDVWEQGTLTDLEGVGPAIAQHLDELFTTGEVSHFTKVKQGFPKGMFTLLKVSGIGPKSAYKLATELDISTIEELRTALESGAVATLEGFGEKSTEELLKGIEDVEKRQDRILLADALAQAEALREALFGLPQVERVDFLGSLRRRAPTIGDIDLAAAVTHDPEQVIEVFTSLPLVDRVLAAGRAKAMVLLASGTQADLRVQAPGGYGAQLQYFTGSKYHNIALRSYALKKGLSLSEYGIKEVKTGELREYATEEAFYEALGLAWIPPELREERGEIPAAERGELPVLIETSDIKGDLHIHSDFKTSSPLDAGTDPLDQIIAAAQDKDYDYVGISDHSPRISNHTAEEIARELALRRAALSKLLYPGSKPRVLIGLEVDIFADGSLNIPDELMTELDYTIVSVHGGHRQSAAEMTERILSGLAHPNVRILGHPTGRKLLQRPGYEADWERIFTYCAAHGIFVEINASPERLDLPDDLIMEAANTGVRFIINSDAHSVQGLDNMPFGVSTARRGWLTAAQVINTLPPQEFLAALQA